MSTTAPPSKQQLPTTKLSPVNTGVANPAGTIKPHRKRSITGQQFQRIIDEELRKSDPNWKLISQYIGLDSVNINSIDKETGVATIHRASYAGEYEIVKWCLLDEENPCVNLKTNVGRTPLHYATDAGQVKIIKLLIDNGANVNAISLSGRTCAHIAAHNDNGEVMDVLLNYKPKSKRRDSVDLDIEDNNRATVANLLGEDSEVFKILEEYRRATSVALDD